MKFSIVIPLFNKAPYVCETLQSIVDQREWPYEIIIVDDKSDDGSLDLVKDFFRKAPLNFKKNVNIDIVELDENQGPGHARNIGFLKTRGEVVSFLDADDLYSPELIKTALELMGFNEIDFLVLGIKKFPSNVEYPDVRKLNGVLTAITSEAYLLKDPMKTVCSHEFVMGTGSNVFVKRKWLLNTQYVEDVSFNEANDFWFRVLKEVLASQSARIGLLMGSHIRVREVEQSLSRLSYHHWQEIELPPIYTRSLHSENRYETLLAGVICNRWIKHSIVRLASNKQRLIFIYKYRTVFLKQFHYFFLRMANR